MKPIVNLSLLVGLTFLSAVTASAQSARGNMRAVRVQGDVQVSPVAGGPTIKLVEGAVLRDKTNVNTAANGRAILLLSTGSAVSIRPSSQVVIEEFRQDPFKGDLRKMSIEPSSSRTKLFIKNGSLLSSVKKLRSGSEYTVRNPLGAAGVRGTVKEDTYDSTSIRSTTTTLSGSQSWQGEFEGTPETLVGEGDTLVATGKLGPDGKPTEYQQEIVKQDTSYLNLLREESTDMEQVVNEATPVEDGQEPPPAINQPPLPEETNEGGPRNPVNFTSPP